MVVVIIITTPRVGPRAVQAVEGGQKKRNGEGFCLFFPQDTLPLKRGCTRQAGHVPEKKEGVGRQRRVEKNGIRRKSGEQNSLMF